MLFRSVATFNPTINLYNAALNTFLLFLLTPIILYKNDVIVLSILLTTHFFINTLVFAPNFY